MPSPLRTGGSRDLAKQRHAAEALAVSTIVNQPPGSGRHSGRVPQLSLTSQAQMALALGLLPTHASTPTTATLPHTWLNFTLPPPFRTIIAVFVHPSVCPSIRPFCVCVLNLLCVVDLHLIRFSPYLLDSEHRRGTPYSRSLVSPPLSFGGVSSHPAIISGDTEVIFTLYRHFASQHHTQWLSSTATSSRRPRNRGSTRIASAKSTGRSGVPMSPKDSGLLASCCTD